MQGVGVVQLQRALVEGRRAGVGLGTCDDQAARAALGEAARTGADVGAAGNGQVARAHRVDDEFGSSGSELAVLDGVIVGPVHQEGVLREGHRVGPEVEDVGAGRAAGVDGQRVVGRIERAVERQIRAARGAGADRSGAEVGCGTRAANGESSLAGQAHDVGAVVGGKAGAGGVFQRGKAEDGACRPTSGDGVGAAAAEALRKVEVNCSTTCLAPTHKSSGKSQRGRAAAAVVVHHNALSTKA